MPKYILIGLGVPLIVFISIYFWSKLSDQTKNRFLIIVFGLFMLSIFVLLFLLFY